VATPGDLATARGRRKKETLFLSLSNFPFISLKRQKGKEGDPLYWVNNSLRGIQGMSESCVFL
jgi:hypothetical protein